MKANERYNVFSCFFSFKLLAYFSLFFIAVILGIASAILPVKFILMLLVIPLFLFLSLKFSEYAAILLILILFGGVPTSYLPQITIAGGSLRGEDMALIFLFILLVIKAATGTQHRQKNDIILMFKPYVIPLGGLLFMAVLSVVIAVFYKTTPIKDIFLEARPFLSWLLLPILFLAIDSEKKLDWFKKAIVIIVIFLSLNTILKSFLGVDFLNQKELSSLWTSGQGAFESVIRSTTKSIILILATLMYLISTYVFTKKKIKHVFLSLLLIMLFLTVILVGFTRGIWLSAFILIVLLGFLSPNKQYLKLVFWMSAVFLVFILILSAVKPDYLDAATKRLFSVSSEIKEGTSMGRRFIENDYAIDKILENPVLGIGLGGHFKPPGAESIVWPDEVRYIHNLYIYMATKLGLLGLFFVLYFVVVVFKRLYIVYQKINGARRSEIPMLFAIFSLCLTSLILTAFTQPNLATPSGVASIVIAIFLLESMFYRYLNPSNIET